MGNNIFWSSGYHREVVRVLLKYMLSAYGFPENISSSVVSLKHKLTPSIQPLNSVAFSSPQLGNFVG
jgi:hypothetical protein